MVLKQRFWTRTLIKIIGKAKHVQQNNEKINKPWQTVQGSLAETRQYSPFTLGGYYAAVHAFLLLLWMVNLTVKNYIATK